MITKFLDADGVKYFWEKILVRIDTVISRYASAQNFPTVGKDHVLYLAEDEFVLYVWYNNSYASLAGARFLLVSALGGTFSPAELDVLRKNYTGVTIVYGYADPENNTNTYYKLFQLNLRAGAVWTYLAREIEKIHNTVYFTKLTVNMTDGSYLITAPYNLIDHIQDTKVHLQTNERTIWNNKVSAEVNVEETGLNLILSTDDVIE